MPDYGDSTIPSREQSLNSPYSSRIPKSIPIPTPTTGMYVVIEYKVHFYRNNKSRLKKLSYVPTI